MRKELRNGEQLTDEHINMAQGLLKEEFLFIGGFQNCLLSQTCGFTPQEQESIQIHFVAGNHWCVSSSIGKEITVNLAILSAPPSHTSWHLSTSL